MQSRWVLNPVIHFQYPAFFGANWDAFVDDDGLLHGLPSFEALDAGFYICPSPLHAECIYIYLEDRWEYFTSALQAELSSGQEGDADCLDPHCRTRVKWIIEHQQGKSTFHEGLVPISDVILRKSGITANEKLVIIGNSGYFEVWRKPAFESFVEGIDIFGTLFCS